MKKYFLSIVFAAAAILSAAAAGIDFTKDDRAIAEREILKNAEMHKGMLRIQAGDFVYDDQKVVYMIMDVEHKLAAVCGFDYEEAPSMDLVIPETIDVPTDKDENGEQMFEEYRVVAIDNYAFQWMATIKSIKLPESIVAIGFGAFMYCQGLQEIEIPESCTSILPYAFYLCTSLEKVTLPSTLKSIEEETFANCVYLWQINIPETVESIGENAFYKCCELEEFPISKNLTKIEKNPFGDCWKLQKFIVDPENPVFSEIDGVLFSKDKKTLVAFSDGMSHNYVVPEGTEVIGDYAFYYSEYLESVTLPQSLTTIGLGAFMYSNEMPSLHIPANVSKIGMGAFYKANNIKSFTVDSENQYYRSISGVIYNKKGEVLVAFPGARTGEYKAVGTTWAVADYAFSGAEIETVVLPEECELIGSFAFARSQVKAVTMPGVQEIYEQAFFSCYYYKQVILPASIKKLYNNVYYQCANIREIISYAEVPPTCGKDVFDASYVGTPMSVIIGTAEAYKKSSGFSMMKISEGLYKITTSYNAELGSVNVNGKGSNAVLDIYEDAEITITPKEGSTITKVTVNDEDMTEDLLDNCLYLEAPYKNINVVVEFDGGSGISDVENAKIIETEYYDMRGIRVANPENGIFIRSQKTSNGTVRSKVAM